MTEDAANAMKVRLRADLVSAMKDKRIADAKVIRALVAAIDNAEAPPLPAGQSSFVQHHFQNRSAEIERLALGDAHVHEIVLADITERENAASELERLGKIDQAAALRAQAFFARRYLD